MTTDNTNPEARSLSRRVAEALGMARLRLRGWILHWTNVNGWRLPDRIHMYLLTGLPFKLSLIDLKAPPPKLSQEEIDELEALAAKYTAYQQAAPTPDGGGSTR